MNRQLIYIASPYSHPCPYIREQRYIEVTKIVAKLIEHKIYTIPPITFNVPISPYLTDQKTDWKTWKEYDELLLSKCTEMWIVPLDGWDISVGIRAELYYALKQKIPISILELEVLNLFNEIQLQHLNEEKILNILNLKTVEDLNNA